MENSETTKHGVTLVTNKPKTTEARILALESKLGRSLPPDYRDFMLRHNGGRPIERVFRFVSRNGKPSNSVVDWFLSIHDGKLSNLENSIASLENRIPPDTLTIAIDPFGNFVLVGLHGGGLGKVYFWDHEEEPDSEPDWSNTDLVADTFDSFMRGLTPT
jgi:cell wall assembly regulator SMI1